MRTITELWITRSLSVWTPVTDAEVASAVNSPINSELVGFLAAPFVIISNNSEQAVNTYLGRKSELGEVSHRYLVIGRESLKGPKEDFEIFNDAIQTANDFLGLPLNELVYFGDQDYELEYAKSIGLSVNRVHFRATT